MVYPLRGTSWKWKLQSQAGAAQFESWWGAVREFRIQEMQRKKPMNDRPNRWKGNLCVFPLIKQLYIGPFSSFFHWFGDHSTSFTPVVYNIRCTMTQRFTTVSTDMFSTKPSFANWRWTPNSAVLVTKTCRPRKENAPICRSSGQTCEKPWQKMFGWIDVYMTNDLLCCKRCDVRSIKCGSFRQIWLIEAIDAKIFPMDNAYNIKKLPSF